MQSFILRHSLRNDKAAAIPFDDFETNAMGTLNMLEAARRACPESPFVHMSTNKVYGDKPNSIALAELQTRWDYADPLYSNGIAEDFLSINSKHSLFGASKVGGRYNGTGIWPLFWNAHLLFTWRLPYRA